MAAGLLKYYTYCNVLRVDWGRGSFPSRDLAFANTKVVGGEIAFFINTLIKEFNFTASQAHCIGHSLGSYVCGFCGQGVENLGWITALDISDRGNLTNDQKLDPSDARFVDCIHTDIRRTGLFKNLGNPNPHGHIDIYPNGGYGQPKCEFSLLKALIPDFKNLLDPVVNQAYCNHFRAIHYYNESIWNPSCEWKAYECSDYETFLQPDQCKSCGADNTKCAFLGLRAIEYPDKSRKNVKFYMKTKDQPPFCPQP
ncbi:Pancreatic lipase-related protein 2 [Armadillidium vulgare]|nr:Pancreatic lipase-related protein 2 [Armadillidium vulgare]